MSAVPPNLVGPILQSPLAQHHVASIRNNEEAQRASAARQQGRVSEQHDKTVETTDSDTQVHTDAEGSGSQGRAFSDASDQGADTAPAPLVEGDEGRLIDLEA